MGIRWLGIGLAPLIFLNSRLMAQRPHVPQEDRTMENILVVQGLPRLKAWNFQYRSLKLTTSPDDQSISFIDHNSLHISDRELLDRVNCILLAMLDA